MAIAAVTRGGNFCHNVLHSAGGSVILRNDVAVIPSAILFDEAMGGWFLYEGDHAGIVLPVLIETFYPYPEDHFLIVIVGC